MNTIKMFKSVLVILVLSILTGCSDVYDPVSSAGNTSAINNPSELTESLPVSVPVVPAFQTYIRLKPHRAYTFNLSNTGLSKITGIDIENLSADVSSDRPILACENLFIYGSLSDDLIIGCHTSGLDLRELTVENTSSSMLDLKVSLQGIKAKKKAEEEE